MAALGLPGDLQLLLQSAGPCTLRVISAPPSTTDQPTPRTQQTHICIHAWEERLDGCDCGGWDACVVVAAWPAAAPRGAAGDEVARALGAARVLLLLRRRVAVLVLCYVRVLKQPLVP